jgi:hypothetical protein
MKMETYSYRISTYRAQTFSLQTSQYNAKLKKREKRNIFKVRTNINATHNTARQAIENFVISFSNCISKKMLLCEYEWESQLQNIGCDVQRQGK